MLRNIDKSPNRVDSVVKSRQEKIERCIAKIPASYRKTFLKAVSKSSMRAAVNAKCQDCCNWQLLEIRHCQAVTCPLWAYRPYQKTESLSEQPETTL
jgi:hypothetical protein